MNPIRLINLGSLPSPQTQAIYHALAEGMDDDSPDTIVLCRPREPYLCLGYHQVFESIFDPQECARRGLPVLRRRIGGGATYLDENQVFYQCIFHRQHMPVMFKDIFAFALAAPVLALGRLGLNAALHEVNEIEVDGKRIAGTGGGQIGEATVVVGNLLFDFDFAAMAAVWQAPTPAFRGLAQKALRERITCLNELLPGITAEQVADLLIDAYAETMGRPLQPGQLTSAELEAVEFQAAELAATDFLALHRPDTAVAPVQNLKISARASIRYEEAGLAGYTIKGNFWLAGETIQEAVLESQPTHDWHRLEERLRGQPFDQWNALLAKEC